MGSTSARACRSFSSVALILLLLAPARAEDDQPAKQAIGFSSSRGVTGMRDMIDGRVPQDDVSLRFSLRFDYTRTRIEGPLGTRTIDEEQTEIASGCSFLGVGDVGFRLFPFEYRSTPERATDGVGELDLAAKVSWTTDLGGLAPYVTQELATGSTSLEHTYTTEVGGAGTLALFEQRLTFHTNLAFVDRNSGNLAFRYRLGAAFVPYAEEDLVVRVWSYIEGFEYEGTPGSRFTIWGGIQTKLVGTFSIELTLLYVLTDATFVHGVRDVGSFGVRISLGLSFRF
jgi:hypothetical protein